MRLFTLVDGWQITAAAATAATATTAAAADISSLAAGLSTTNQGLGFRV